MKKLILSICLIVTCVFGAQAQFPWQYDSISMGANANDDVYYEMNTAGAVSTASNLGWHIALAQLGIADSAAIWANHNYGNSYTVVYDINKVAGDWASVSLTDTLLAPKLFNGVDAWHQGALNNIPSANPFNFGWGTYVQANHTIVGDRIFIIKADGIFYKVLIEDLEAGPMIYTVKVGLFDMANTTNTYQVMKAPTYTNKQFAYMNLATGQFIDREPDLDSWDIVFTKFTDLVAPGPPPTPAQPYNVVGILSNRAALTTQAFTIDVDDAETNYSSTYASNLALEPISEIGWDWKQYNGGTMNYDIVDSNSYFIQSIQGNVWQLEFLGYSGLGDGNIQFRKRLIAYPIGVDEVTKNNSLTLYPNPASEQINLIFESSKVSELSIKVHSMNGAVVLNTKKSAQSGLNVWTLPTNQFPNGNYVISIEDGSQLRTQKMTILR